MGPVEGSSCGVVRITGGLSPGVGRACWCPDALPIPGDAPDRQPHNAVRAGPQGLRACGAVADPLASLAAAG